MSYLSLAINRSLRNEVLRCKLPFSLTYNYCTEVDQTLEKNTDEVIISGKKYENRKAENLPSNHSRMNPMYRNRMLHILEPHPSEAQPDYFTSVRRKPAFEKLVFASYGKRSGIDPGRLWPSAEELEEMKEFEAEWEPSLQTMWENLRVENEQNLAAIVEREAKVDLGLSRMPKYIEEYKKKKERILEQERKLQEKKQKMVDEARDLFGYHIDQSDPRFEQLKLQREEEERKMKKKLKKESRTNAARSEKAQETEVEEKAVGETAEVDSK